MSTTVEPQATDQTAGSNAQATQELPDHRGQPRHADAELFASPPPEIGQVLSAESTLKLGQTHKPLAIRLMMAVLAGGGVAVGLFWLARNAMDQTVLVALAAILGFIVAATVWFFTRFKHRCTYVGKDGIARFDLRGRRDGSPKFWTLRFADAAALRASQTRHFVNGIYTGTNYDYRWVDDQGRRMSRLAGRYSGNKKPPKAGDAFHFVSAAEVSWSNHMLARIARQLETEGSIPFRVDAKRLVRVGPGFLEFHFGGEEPVRVTKEEIAKVTLGSGRFAFTHTDAKWYSRAGKYSFQYGQMDNGKVFLFALEKLMGYRWS